MTDLHPNIVPAEDGQPAFVVLPFREYELLRHRAAEADEGDELPRTPEEAAQAAKALEALFSKALASDSGDDLADGFAKRGLPLK